MATSDGLFTLSLLWLNEWRMDPNQQPAPLPQPEQPQPTVAPQPVYAQPVVQSTQPTPGPLTTPSTYVAPAPGSYDPNYLDSIAPPPARAKLFSGSFAKIFYAMLGVFVLAVSLIVAFSGKDKTADLQQTTVRISNFQLIAKTEQKNLKSSKLLATNGSFQLLLVNAQTDGEKLLGQAGVKKTQYDKTMVKAETKINTDLTTKFENARLNADLDLVYANSMSGETAQIIGLLNIMAKKSGAKAIRDYAAALAKNLTPIQKTFSEYTDDGN
ncbi:MAG: hypothetical protein JWO07_738 [Candidatus Saccharibacteria bacterium]|nr:hypothetical protein [Candidatus Saccharibacteria bacterium]